MDKELEYKVYEYLHTYLKYHPDSGKLVWIAVPPKHTRAKIGREAGSRNTAGYKVLYIWGRSYKVHRLIWLYVKGNFPDRNIDHINGIKDDNTWGNLREATTSQNGMNTVKLCTNTSGYKGVYLDRGKYRAKIGFNNKLLHIGTYSTAEEAARAYDIRAKKLYKEFAKLNFPG